MRPCRLIILALLPVLALLPPESRGESMAGSALLIGLLAILCWRAGAATVVSQVGILAGAATAGIVAWFAFVPAAAVEPLALALGAVTLGLAAAGCEDDEKLTRAALVTLGLVGCVVALYALYQWGWGLERLADIVRADPAFPDRDVVLRRLGRGRAFAWFATPATLGGFLALCVPASIGLALSTTGRLRMAWSAAALVGGAAFMAAASATAAAALLAAVTLAAVAGSRGRRRLAIGVAVLLVVLAGVAWIRGGRVLSLTDEESPWRLRAGNLRVAASMAAEHPWTGVGPGGFAERYPAYRQPGDNETRHAHNLPLELVAEWGVPAGTALALIFFFVFLKPLWREREGPAWRRGLAIGLAAFALQNLADFTVFMPSLFWTAALLRGRLGGSPGEETEAETTGLDRLFATGSLSVALLAVLVAASSGLSANARLGGRAAAFAGESDEAHALAARATRLAPWDVDAAVLSARIAVDRWQQEPTDVERAAEAAGEVERLVRLAPVRASARELRARVRLVRGDAPGALVDLGMASMLNPADDSYRDKRDRLQALLAARARERNR